MLDYSLSQSNSFLMGDQFSMITVEAILLAVIAVTTGIYLYDRYCRKHEP